jgi:hypothetical protein
VCVCVCVRTLARLDDHCIVDDSPPFIGVQAQAARAVL